ncbi:NAD(P)-dependent dehydrogenase (short-subunit alcohol dehydrogenase family) [Catenuloplanes nepalensis]|uniref:NAD(P)-dependent dehydrogenase (Short-subunit alcohol dehydrogenase family) n=1 Tax=Catenuloplanes nepalensis TaxID=587533 RepID=A0ABT9MXI5_9ACTN|nr:SDR family oxidoreductase [Catenuloplanes nepalensis]MDP9796157.1 NAD(P)-dependent dehydrogenase (short-subunit alcohol dehydrogenase family) [Catenuloplanes nepalensis]
MTGGTRGIGAAVARELAGVPGSALVLGYRGDHERARAIVAELDRAESPVRAVACDVAEPARVAELFAAADALGELTGLVNSAAVLERQCGFGEIGADRWARVLGVNVTGTATCCAYAMERMRAGGVIVNLSSRAAVLGAPGEYVDYAASKAAVDTITRGLGLEAAPRGIRVVGVRPGIIDTEIHASGGDPDRARRVGPTLPLGRAGTPEDIARTVAWLLSPAAAYITATTIDVSGGR